MFVPANIYLGSESAIKIAAISEVFKSANIHTFKCNYETIPQPTREILLSCCEKRMELLKKYYLEIEKKEKTDILIVIESGISFGFDPFDVAMIYCVRPYDKREWLCESDKIYIAKKHHYLLDKCILMDYKKTFGELLHESDKTYASNNWMSSDPYNYDRSKQIESGLEKIIENINLYGLTLE